MPRKPNPTGFGPDYMNVREQLAPLINKALEAAGLPYRVELARDLTRIYAGHWQRSAGAATWFVMAHHVDNPDATLEILSFDTMSNCLRYGFTLDRETHSWVINANRDANGKLAKGAARDRTAVG